MDIVEQEEGENEDISPIIQIFERLTFERGHEIHDLITSIIDLFSSTDITLDMLDTLIDCVKIIFVHPHTNKNLRILDFLTTLTHVTHINYNSNTNLALVFDALIDIFTQTMISIDSQIRYTTFRILNKIQTLIDLSRSPHLSNQFEQNLLELLNNENTLFVLDEIVFLAAKFQHRNTRFIDAFLSRLKSSKWTSYVDRRRQILSLIEYSSSSLQYLLSIIENENDLIQIAFESLLSDERGFTLETIGIQGRLILFKFASSSRDLSRFIYTHWIHQTNHELIDILRLCQIVTLNERIYLEKTLEYFLQDENIRRVIINNLKTKIGDHKSGLLPSNSSNYIENLFLWRLLCQLTNEEDDDLTIHPDFHELITYFYRLIKSSINENLSSTKEFLLCQYASILSTYDLLDIYRRKCLEAIGRCILVHYGQYEKFIEQAFDLIHRSSDTIDERYQLVTYTLNDIIQRCQNDQSEKRAFIQCMNITKVFIEKEKSIDLKRNDFKQLIDSLIKSGLANQDVDIQLQTLTTQRTFMCHSKEITIEYLKQNLQMIENINDIKLKSRLLSTFFDVLLIHDLDILVHLNVTPKTFLIDLFTNLFNEQNIDIKHLLVFGLIKLFLSSRLQPSIELLKYILDYRFSNDYRFITDHQRDEITTFFYYFIHLSISNVLLIENLTFELVSRCLPFLSDHSTIAYQTILIESMCSFCIEILSLPTLPIDPIHPESSHYRLARNLLESIENSTNNRISFILKSYLTTIKHLQFQYMTEKQLETILKLILSLRQYQNLPSNVGNLIKNIEEHLQSCLKLINKLTRGSQDDKRPRSPSPSSQLSVKRISLTFEPSMSSSPNVLQDRTNQIFNPNENRLSLTSKGVKRKARTQRYSTLDFENEDEDFF